MKDHSTPEKQASKKRRSAKPERDAGFAADWQVPSWEGVVPVPIGRPAQGPTIQRKAVDAEALQEKPFGVDAEFEGRLKARQGSGQPLPSPLQGNMGARMGGDFSQVRVHRDPEAQHLASRAGARAFTWGQNVYFGSGEWKPQSRQGQHLIGHELTHVMQNQGAAAAGRQIHRSAKAEWEEATRSDQVASLKDSHGNDPRNPTIRRFDKQEAWREEIAALEGKENRSKKEDKRLSSLQGKLTKAEADGDLVGLPTVDAILGITATYHHYSSFPSGDPEKPFVVDQAVLNAVKKKYRALESSSPNFWPNIIWIDKEGMRKDIGVRFHLNFQQHDPPEKGKGKEGSDYKGVPNALGKQDEVIKNPWDNFFAFYQMDKLTSMASFSDLEAFVTANGLKGFSFGSDDKGDFMKAGEGEKAKTFRDAEIFEAKMLIRKAYQDANLKAAGDPIKNDILGLGNRKGVGIDPFKTAPETQTYNRYDKDPYAPEDYYTGSIDRRLSDADKKLIKEKLEEPKTQTFTESERLPRLAGVIAHEIGHNIGMFHSDLGLMSEATESNSLTRERDRVNLPSALGNTGSGTKSYSSEYLNPEIQIFIEYNLELKDEHLQKENVQRLVNRIRSSTSEMPQTRDEYGYLSDKVDFWDQMIPAAVELFSKAKADAPAYKDELFKAENAFYLQLLVIPYDLGALVGTGSKQSWEGSRTETDMAIIQEIVNNGFFIEEATWDRLSEATKLYILKDSIRALWDTSDRDYHGTGSGLTYFENEATMNKMP